MSDQISNICKIKNHDCETSVSIKLCGTLERVCWERVFSWLCCDCVRLLAIDLPYCIFHTKTEYIVSFSDRNVRCLRRFQFIIDDVTVARVDSNFIGEAISGNPCVDNKIMVNTQNARKKLSSWSEWRCNMLQSFNFFEVTYFFWIWLIVRENTTR